MTHQHGKIVLLLDRELGARLSGVASGAHVWVCGSPSNRKVVEAIWSTQETPATSSTVTVFDVTEKQSPEAMCQDVVWTIYEHHPGWLMLEVHGAELSEGLRTAFAGIGAQQCLKTQYGFRCTRNRP
jgi:hypothetical protein